MAIEVLRVRLAREAMKTYPRHRERSAMRCALGDAATLLDTLARHVADENKGRNGKGRVTKRGLALKEIVQQAADQVWLLREEIVHDTPEPPKDAG